MLPQLSNTAIVQSSAATLVGLSPATLVIVSKTGVAYGYPLSALKKAFGWSYAKSSQFFNEMAEGKVSVGKAWSMLKKACESTGKKHRKYTTRQSITMMQNAILKKIA